MAEAPGDQEASVSSPLSQQSAQVFEARMSEHFNQLRSQGVHANDAAALALKLATSTAQPPVSVRHVVSGIHAYAERPTPGGERQLRAALDQTFSSPDTLATSFLLRSADPQAQVPLNIDFAALHSLYGAIRDQLPEWQSVLLDLSCVAVSRLQSGLGLNKQRTVCILLDNPGLEDPVAHPLVEQLAEKVAATWTDQEQNLLVQCFRQYTSEQLQLAVGRVQSYITIHFYTISGVDDHIAHAAQLLLLMHRANEAANLIPYTDFHNGVVNQEDFDLKKDYIRWRRAAGFNFCGRYSFMFGPAAKARLLYMENQAEQMHEFQGALMHAVMAGGGPIPFLYLRVRRGVHLVHDTMLQLQNAASQGMLKQPLRVKFAGEEGVDEGGVSKELFQQLMRQLFDPAYGMFVAHETTRMYWFRSSGMDMPMEFELVGILLALAIYNGIVLELAFPMVTYKKLLSRAPTFADLQEVQPEIHDGLCKLRDMDEEQIAGLQLTFQVEQEGHFGAANELVDLRLNGGSIPVTTSNREEYLKLYANHLLTSSIKPQFDSFRAGFRKLCKGPSIERFQPEELEQLVCGSRALSYDELEAACRYEDGYTAKSEVVRWFWEVAHALPEDGKRRLLGFITGSDRVPIDGLRNLRPPFTISRNGDHSDRLPTAHTCFNHLLLPQYRDKETMRGRIELAINNAEGFGLR